jgi:tetratricopeptide (TPR) repeat protein
VKRDQRAVARHVYKEGGGHLEVMSYPSRTVSLMRDVVSIGTRLGPRKGCRRAPGARAWYERGVAIESTDPAGARRAYERALAANPELSDASCNLGRLAHEAGDVTGAEACYRLALCANREVGVYWFNLGVALEDQGRRAEAVAAYREALARAPKLPDAHFNLARLLERAGEVEQAIRHLHAYRAVREPRRA